ncbi:MAG: R3H domain-containing nucleic acid-binding protein, partial [bacterium]|nr:R3H domain-containing nucleic acid-binding protein [bacterium]
LEQKIKKIVTLMGLREATVEIDEAGRRVNILANEDEWFKKWVPDLVRDFRHLISVMTRKDGGEYYFVDINNYRKEREKLIGDLAKAAAQKAVTTKTEVRLPAMNAYERRIVHTELSMRPDIKTESAGEGEERSVVIKPI